MDKVSRTARQEERKSSCPLTKRGFPPRAQPRPLMSLSARHNGSRPTTPPVVDARHIYGVAERNRGVASRMLGRQAAQLPCKRRRKGAGRNTAWCVGGARPGSFHVHHWKQPYHAAFSCRTTVPSVFTIYNCPCLHVLSHAMSHASHCLTHQCFINVLLT